MLNCSAIPVFSTCNKPIFYLQSVNEGLDGMLDSQARLSVTCGGDFSAISLINERLV